MIYATKMLDLADEKVRNAPNRDWQGRGRLIMVGNPREVPVISHDNIKLGDATVVAFKFEKQNADRFSASFVGFTLAAMEVGGKFIAETCPTINALREGEFENTAYRLVHRFCPQCHSLDSVYSKSRRRGPECVFITYRCKKCNYVDHDVMD